MGTHGKPELGCFFVLEGIEGVGKTTQLDRLTSFVHKTTAARGQELVITREPGGTPLGEALRELLLRTDIPAMAAETELMLMFAARAEHVDKVIRPALERGAIVISDRFVDATWAYQGGGRGLADEHIAALERLALGDTRPDLVLILDADPELALARVNDRGESDRFERERLAFFSAVRARYLARAAAEPDRYAVIDAARSPDQVAAEIETRIANRLEGIPA
ncbi:MAG: dTMP kinase [Gammaproteobacteria bacterium]|nr:dTMP kinase [Gammaproteobacteria bacterium]